MLVLTRTDLSDVGDKSVDHQLRPDLDRETFTIEFTSPQSLYYVIEPQCYSCRPSGRWSSPMLRGWSTPTISIILKLLVNAPKLRPALLLWT